MTENSQVVGDYYPQTQVDSQLDYSVPCEGDCGAEIYQGRWSLSLETGYCPSCRRPCAWCGDWIAGEPETIINGEVWHQRCMSAKADEDSLDVKPGMFESWGDVFTHPAVLIAVSVVIAIAIYFVWITTVN